MKCTLSQSSSNPRVINRLNEIDELFKNNITDLIPRPMNPFLDAARVFRISGLFSYGESQLDEGGIDKTMPLDLTPPRYYGYRPQIFLEAKQEKLKSFLIEENAISSMTPEKFNYVSFGLGSHELFVRLLTCLYAEFCSNEMFFPEFGYGLFYFAAANIGYRINILHGDINSGEKIKLSEMRKNFLKYKNTKILYLEAKTMAGIIYSETELSAIIDLCKIHDVFLIYDMAHLGLELKPGIKQTKIDYLCYQKEFLKYAILYTASKTYGLEGGRIGFCVTNANFLVKNKTSINTILYQKMRFSLFRNLGTIPIDIMLLGNALIETPLEKRILFLDNLFTSHLYNLSLIIGYIEGINSTNIIPHLRDKITESIPVSHHNGMLKIKLIAIPESGIQIKVSVKNFMGLYFAHFHVLNAEIFSYLLSAFFGVVTLHSYQLTDFSGQTLRLSFSSENAIHQGMQSLYLFISSLTIEPFFLGKNNEVFSYLNEREKNIVIAVKNSRHDQKVLRPNELLNIYRRNLLFLVKFKTLFINNKNVDEMLNNLALQIQMLWHHYINKKQGNGYHHRNIINKVTIKDAFWEEQLNLFNEIYQSSLENKWLLSSVVIAGFSAIGFFAYKDKTISSPSVLLNEIKGRLFK